ncbi:hypothetical protein OH77DRAFT_840244 [Trametes cingulata]|nr:hypothetical protein OH77DRAFT_840244 [Trametes cingulata]
MRRGRGRVSPIRHSYPSFSLAQHAGLLTSDASVRQGPQPCVCDALRRPRIPAFPSDHTIRNLTGRRETLRLRTEVEVNAECGERSGPTGMKTTEVARRCHRGRISAATPNIRLLAPTLRFCDAPAETHGSASSTASVIARGRTIGRNGVWVARRRRAAGCQAQARRSSRDLLRIIIERESGSEQRSGGS